MSPSVPAAKNTSDAHRVLTVPPHFVNPQKGKDVTALQKAVNHRIKNEGLPVHPLKVDGQCGRATVATTRRVAHFLGIGVKGPGVTVYLQNLTRDPTKRTPTQVKRGARYRAAHKDTTCHVHGNKVTGGSSAQERAVAAAMEAAHEYYAGRSHRFYSQSGTTQFALGITGEPAGYRSDCSQWFCSMYFSAGGKDPCAGDFNPAHLHYTGTIPHGGKYVRREQLKPGGAVLYGPPPHHHVEMWAGNGDGKTTYAQLARAGSPLRDRTVGHGSPPVDYGDIDMIGGPVYFVNPA